MFSLFDSHCIVSRCCFCLLLSSAGRLQTLLSRVTANPQMDSNLNLNFTITFDSLGYVHCTLTFVMSSALDTGRYGSPASLYFKVVPDASTVLVIGVDDLKFSPLQNTTNILTISPTPQLTEEEYLEISITGCSGFGGALSAGVTPVWSQNTVRFGWGASTLKTLALMLPTFAYGGLHASCDVSFTGTISALQRYQTQSTIDIRASKKVQLTAELDLVTTPLGMFNPVSEHTTHNRTMEKQKALRVGSGCDPQLKSLRFVCFLF